MAVCAVKRTTASARVLEVRASERSTGGDKTAAELRNARALCRMQNIVTPCDN